MNWIKLFRYDAWANDLTLSSIRDQGDAGEDAHKLYAHVLAAQHIWLGRLLRKPSSIQVWPSMTMTEMERHTRDLPAKWASFVTDSADGLDELCSYRNTKGEKYETPANDILMHVIVHSAYHRGQVAVALRNMELVPAVTDFIAFARR